VPRDRPAGDPLDDLTAMLLADGVDLHRAIGIEVRLRERLGGKRYYVRRPPEHVGVAPARPGGQSNC
jgi:hypothetical protein